MFVQEVFARAWSSFGEVRSLHGRGRARTSQGSSNSFLYRDMEEDYCEMMTAGGMRLLFSTAVSCAIRKSAMFRGRICLWPMTLVAEDLRMFRPEMLGEPMESGTFSMGGRSSQNNNTIRYITKSPVTCQDHEKRPS